MSDEINAVIDNLCNKFGVTLEWLIPEMAKYYIAVDLIEIIILGIIIAVLLFFIFKFYKKETDLDFESFDKEMDIFLLCIPVLIVGIFLVIGILDLAGWIISPTISTFNKIISLIGGA